MGEVYRARDTRLGRDVAIKVLPHARATTLEARARFDREARAIASLHHPHICTLHDVGHESDLDFLVMEKLDGETLATRLSRGRMTPKEALTLGIEIAGALEAAHQAGIVHRDLKPGNIMLTPGGSKLLDFGLARASVLAPPPSDRSQSPTVTQPLTAEGAIVGTFQYMSPEQLEGREADARSDIHALGTTLYEAVAGRQAFEGRSPASLIAAILKDEPRSLSELQPLTPPALERVVRVCLAKDPGERWQSAGDLRRELEWISTESGAAIGASSSSIRMPAPPRRRFSSRWLMIGGAAVAAIALGLVFLPKGSPRLNPDMRTRIVDVPMSGIDYPGMSQDGSWIALPARDEHGVSGLYFMNSHGGGMRPIDVDSTFYVYYADISPDGSQIAYAGNPSLAESEIRVVPALGGDPRRLARPGFDPRWSPDGKRIGYVILPWASPSRNYELWTVRPDGSGRSLVFVDSTSESGVSFCFAWSPDGKRIAWLRNFDHSSYNEIVIHDLQTGGERQLTHDRKIIDEVEWTRQDEIVFSSNRGGATNLWIMRATGGRPTQLTRGAGPDKGIRVSADGRTALYLNKRQLETIGWWDVVTGESGRVTREDEPLGMPVVPSGDGMRIALPIRDPDAVSMAQAVMVMNRDGSGRRTVITAEQDPRAFDWAPDDRSIAWARSSTSGDSMDLHIADVRSGEDSGARTIPTRGRVTWLNFIDPDTLRVLDRRGSFDYSISKGRVVDRSRDLEFYYQTRVPGWIVFFKSLSSGLGIFIRRTDGNDERLVMPGRWMCANPTMTSFLYCWPESLGLSRLELPSGRLQSVAHVPPGLSRDMRFFPTSSGRVMFWVRLRPESKLVLVENLHR